MDQNPSDTLESNIWKIALSDILFSFGLINAIYILFFRFLGFTFNDIGLYEAITSLAIITTELPTGVLADSIGRKWTISVANAFMLCFALLLGFSEGGFLVIVFAGLFSGLEFSFKSGAKTALLYDTLKELNREDEFLKISGRINAFSTVSRIIGMILGAFLFAVNPRLPYWLWALFIGMSVVTMVTVYEPKKLKKKYSLKNHFVDMKKNVLFIFCSKKLLWISFFFLVADVFAESYWDVFSQAHLKLTGLNPSVFGIVFAVFAGVNALGSYFVDDIENLLGEKGSLYIIILVQVFLFGFMAFCGNWVVLVFLLIILTTTREFSWLLREYYSNQYIPSERRAGILSAISFLYNGLFGGALIIWLFGYSIDVLGGSKTLIISSLCVLVVGIGLLQLRYSKFTF